MAKNVESQNKKALKDVYGSELLPENVKLSDIKARIKDTDSKYVKVLERMRILDGTDRGKLWDVVKAKFPKYQLTPDSNWVNYIKENLVASIYTTGRYAELVPKSNDDIKFVVEFNAALETIWDNIKADYYQFLAGERAALLNIGITQVGWRKNMIGGTKNYWYQGDVVFKNIDPMKFRRDPYADVFDNAEFCYYYDDYSLAIIKSKEQYKKRIQEIEKAIGVLKDNGAISEAVTAATDRQKENGTTTNYHKVTYYYTMYNDDSKDNKEGYKIAEIHLLDDEYVLYCNPDLKPKMFPFAILYCNDPAGDIVGASEPAKQFQSNLTYNLLNSIYATHAYKAQRPPRFVNAGSGINLRQFAKYGNDADKTFIVNGDASQAVHYAQFPQLPPELLQVKQDLGRDIKDCSGIDEMYAGKNTGSIQTTGGMDALQEVTSQRDNQKILLWEEYSKRLTELVVNNLITFGDKRTYTVVDPITQQVKEVSFDFPKVDDDIRFRYSLNIQTYLPRNKARLSMIANMLLEKQAQYKPDPEIITVEEWLLMQDIPFKDMIFKRMGIQRNTRITEQVAETLEMFATLVEGGVDPDLAVEQVANQLQAEQQQTTLGNTATAQDIGALIGGTPQAAQAGPAGQSFGPDAMM
jgi:hypothetical protein